MPGDELTRAKNLETLGFPAGFETTGGMAGNLSELVIYGLPDSFFSDYVPKIQAVTAADVERAAKQYLVNRTSSRWSSSAISRRSRSRSGTRISGRCGS